jgi:probable rRNA maturation factor
VRRAVQLTAAHCSFPSGTIDVAIVDDAQSKEVNVRHLQHDWETDVISFPYHAEQGQLEGELVISWETAWRESQSQRWPAITELVLYAIHGTLHLTGMDDATPSQRAAMRSAEKELLAALQPPGWQFYQVDEPEEST